MRWYFSFAFQIPGSNGISYSTILGDINNTGRLTEYQLESVILEDKR